MTNKPNIAQPGERVVTCRGSVVLGTACGKCERCLGETKAKPSATVSERIAKTDTVAEACPLCQKPLEVLENGRAWCRNLIENPDTYAEWAEGSCILAVYAVCVPLEVWEQLNAAKDAQPTTLQQSSGREEKIPQQ